MLISKVYLQKKTGLFDADGFKHQKNIHKIKKRKMDINQIFKNNQKWVQDKLQGNDEYFHHLSQGQSPEILYIGWSDSTVTDEDIMGIQPGEAFIHRNIANLVPNTDLSAMTVINYAVQHLKVNHIVVCGHYYCGGVKAAMQSQDLGILNPWLRNIRDVYRTHQNQLYKFKIKKVRYKPLVELNVQLQCNNVIKTDEEQKAYVD